MTKFQTLIMFCLIKWFHTTNLYSIFGQVSFESQNLPGVNIWVVGVFECLFELFELKTCENGPENDRKKRCTIV